MVGAGTAALLAVLLGAVVVAGADAPTALDMAVLDATRAWTASAPGVVDAAALVGAVTDLVVSFLVAGAVTVALLLRRQRVPAGFVAASGLLGVACVEVTKALVDRPRPAGAEAFVDASSGSSFPSGHASVGIYIYLALAVLLVLAGRHLDLRALVGAGWLLAAFGVLIGVSRVVLGVHWATDVLAGWCVGSAVVLAVAALLRPDDVMRRRRS